jgi:hypothetical protein
LKRIAGAEVLAGEQGLGKALLYIVSTGDRAIQTLLENQVHTNYTYIFIVLYSTYHTVLGCFFVI